MYTIVTRYLNGDVTETSPMDHPEVVKIAKLWQRANPCARVEIFDPGLEDRRMHVAYGPTWRFRETEMQAPGLTER